MGGWVVCDLEERLEDVPDDVLKVVDPRISRALKQHMYLQRVLILICRTQVSILFSEL